MAISNARLVSLAAGRVRYYGFLSPKKAVFLDDVRALVAQDNGATGDTIATAPRLPDVASMSGESAITAQPCPHCGDRLRFVESLFHRASFRDSGQYPR